MKYLFILLFATFGLNASAQDTSPKVTKLMEQELKMIQKDLLSQKETQELSVEQTSKIKKLLLAKAEKVNAVRLSNDSKSARSQSLKNINKEFEPAILAVFNNEQKAAFKSSPRNKKRIVKK